MKPLIAPDVEALVIAYLTSALDVPVANEVLEGENGLPRHPLFVRVVAAGGPGRTSLVIDTTNVTVEAWAPDSVTAVHLARLVEAHLTFWPNTNPAIRRVQQWSTVANIPDPVTSLPRYIQSFAITTRATELEANDLDLAT